MPSPKRLVLAVFVLGATAGALVARPPTPPAAPLSALAFMAGCWRGPSGEDTVIEEYYTAPAENVMLGVSRYLRGERVTGFEFTSIVREDSAIIVTPRPEGQKPVPFRVTRIGKNSVVWENPAHDFPRLISYRLLPGDTLVARVEGPGRNGVRSEEWRMTPARCAGA